MTEPQQYDSEKAWRARRRWLRAKVARAGHPSLSRYDGTGKHWTTGCELCPKRLALGRDEICTVGVAWKVLFKVVKPRKCSLVK